MTSKFREHLSITTLLPNHLPVEISKFSPSSIIEPRSSPFSFARGSSTPSSFRDRFTRLFLDINSNAVDQDSAPLPLSQWPPLHIEKHHCACQVHDLKYEARVRKQRRRSQCLLVLFILLLLFLTGNLIFLNIRVLSLPTPPSTSETTSTPQALSANAQQCLSQYTLNAPTSPGGYPCSTCLSVLQAVPSSYMSNSANYRNARLINNVIQFCSLRAIYETSNAQGRAALGNGSWAQNVNFCTWTGVRCDTLGQVSSVKLTYPSVPATLPNEIGALTTLQTLEVIGGNSIPAGSLPSSFTNLTSLTTLRLEATSITALPDSLFVSPGLTLLSTLALVRNAQMGSTLPSSLASLAGLQSLLVISQTLSPSPLAMLAASSSLASSMRILDLTSTSLRGSIPSSLSSFKGLTQLWLGSNHLTGIVPTLPSTLQVLELSGNTGLVGSITCSPTPLAQCSVQGTAISVAGCGVCQNNKTSAL